MKFSTPHFSREELSNVFPIFLLAFFAQAVALYTSSIIAKKFGVGSEFDSYVAALMPLQYITSVIFMPIPSILIPIYIESLKSSNSEDAEELVGGIVLLFTIVTVLITCVSILFSKKIISMTTPGLSFSSLSLAQSLTVILWPTIMGTMLLNVQTSISQANHRFIFQGSIVLLGSFVNLILISLLVPYFGVLGIAISYAASLAVQVGCLWPIMPPFKFKHGFYFWRRPAVQGFFLRLSPLMFLNVFSRIVPLVGPHFASNLTAGALSHLNYTTKIFVGFTLLVSSGIPTIAFPKMSMNYSKENGDNFQRSFFNSLEFMLLLTAPLILFGVVFSLPLVQIVFEKGRFSPQDSLIVSDLLKIYLFSLVGISFGNITGKVFYIYGRTRMLVTGGLIESLLYVWLTAYLFRWQGLRGIALSYALYFNLSLLWHLLYFRMKLGIKIPWKSLSSFGQIGLSAALSAAAAKFIFISINKNIPGLLIGGSVGGLIYLCLLRFFNSRNLRFISRAEPIG